MATVPDLSGNAPSDRAAPIDEHIQSEREILEQIEENTTPAP
jgi:hypothetical protein